MSGDIAPVGFAGAHGERPSLRARRVVGLVVGVALLGGGLVAAVAGVVGVVRHSQQLTDDAVASSTVSPLDTTPERGATFDAPQAGRYTVWLHAPLGNDAHRDAVVAAANCVARFADGSSAAFRGARQGTSVTIGDRSTIGTFEAPAGRVEVRCRNERWGSRRNAQLLDDERTFTVVAGGPSVGDGTWLLLGGIAAALAGGALVVRNRRIR